MKATIKASVISNRPNNTTMETPVNLSIDLATMRITVDASSLRFPPGFWPLTMEVQSDNEKIVMRCGGFEYDREGDIASAEYWQVGAKSDAARIRMTVLND